MDKNMLKRVRHISPVLICTRDEKLQNVTFGILSSASCLHYKAIRLVLKYYEYYGMLKMGYQFQKPKNRL